MLRRVRSSSAWTCGISQPSRVARRVTELYVQRNQPPGVPPLHLTGERTLPDVPEENYWYQRHLVVYRWIADRVHGPRERRGLRQRRAGPHGRERRRGGGQPGGLRARAAEVPAGHLRAQHDRAL